MQSVAVSYGEAAARSRGDAFVTARGETRSQPAGSIERIQYQKVEPGTTATEGL
jgi:hypothetical protein